MQKIDPRDGPDDWEAPQRLVPHHKSEHDGCCEEYRVNAPAAKCRNCPRRPESTSRYKAVTVEINGEKILTIEDRCLSGIENIDEYADEVRWAGEQLLAFIGAARPDRIVELEKQVDRLENGDPDHAY